MLDSIVTSTTLLIELGLTLNLMPQDSLISLELVFFSVSLVQQPLSVGLFSPIGVRLVKRFNTRHLVSGIKMTAAVLVLAVGTGTTPTEAALIGYWDFNEAIDTADAVDSVAGNNAVLGGAATRAAGPTGFGRALDLDGTPGTFAEVGVVPALNLTGNNYTVAFWAKPTAISAGFNRIITMDDGLDFSGGYTFAIDSTSSSLFVGHNSGSNNNTTIGGTTFTLGAWSHYAITYDASSVGSERKIYQDGALVATTAIAGGNILDDGDDSLVFGDIPPFNQNFVGSLDEIRFYSNTLTESEIAVLAVPEPSSMVLLASAGIAGLLLVVRRRKR